jgi:asparagine synthase (glutamine-hydrolysing)
MCGIAGVLHLDGRHADESHVERLTAVLAHRGPDGQGVWVHGPVGLGHRRLAVIDLSAAGRQPMSNEDGAVRVTYNGEIYNFAELRSELELRGHRFRSATDTEVVVHAYEEWGVECVKRFNGMFAFALWDGRRRRLWLARDRLGIKPLFFAHLRDRLLFGSEIKAILADPDVERGFDYQALSYYLSLNYVPAPYTLFAGIRQLMPGQHLEIDASGTARLTDYWDVVYREDVRRSEREWVDELSALLEDAVRIRLVSDVPFAAFLSGGVDSSAVTWWMSKHTKDRVKTFSIAFGEESYDELEFAREVARLVNADRREKMVTARAAEILPRLVWHAEEPTADSSMIAVYYLAQVARQEVTMALAGDGADEILAGYETYQAHYLYRVYRRLPRWLRRGILEPLVRALPVSDARVSLDYRLKRFVAADGLTPEDAHPTWRMIFDAGPRRRMLAPVADQLGSDADVLDLYRACFARTNARHPLNRMLYVDTRLYLPNDMLVKVDRMTMAHGLEARVPFLDHRLVEFAASVPPRLKLKGLRHKKYLLKASLAGRLPRRVLRRGKQGFNVPVARWLKGELLPFAREHLSPALVRDIGVLDAAEVERVTRDHLEGRADNSHQIWCLLTLSLWWQQFLRG